ncbi:MFS transporter [Sinomicrobium sp.]
MNKKLLSLAIGGFGIGMTEFVMMGILPDIAKSLNISIPMAGHFISSYALGVVIGAPLMVAIAGKYPPKKILMALMLFFTVGNLLSAFAPDYYTLLSTRFLSGLPHGAFFGIGAVVAGRLALEGKQARAVSMMFAGLTIANILGVPLGTYIGHHIDWRYTFVIVSGIGIITVLALCFWLPNLPAAPSAGFLKELKLFTHLKPWLIILLTAIGTGGFFAWYSYIAPLLTDVAGFSSNSITYLLVVAGVGMTLGNIFGGRLADRFSPINATSVLLLTMSIALVTLTFAAHYKIPAVLMTFVVGTLAFSITSPIQMMMIRAARGSEMLASSLTQGAFNIGNAVGAYLGGLPLQAGYSYTSPDWVGAGLAISGFAVSICILVLDRKMAKKTKTVITG